MPTRIAHFPLSHRRAGPLSLLGRRGAAPKVLAQAMILLALVLAPGCQSKPTQDQCNALADHLAEQIQAAQLKNASNAQRFTKDERDHFVLTCVREGSFRTVECMLKAPTWEALQSECSP